MKESKIFSGQNLTEIVHYVYRVTIDGKYYIGKHTGLLNDLHTGRYKTSSNIIKEKLQNGVTFSKIKILKVFSSSKDALEFEERILTRVDAKRNPKFLNQTNGDKNFYNKQHTEKTKEKMSEIRKEYFNPNTEAGIKRRKNMSEKGVERFNPNTEQGIKRRKNASEKGIKRFNPDTEEGIKRREHQSNKKKEYYNPDTEEGQIHLEENRRKQKEYYNPETERGQKNLEKRSELSKALFDINTERGRKKT